MSEFEVDVGVLAAVQAALQAALNSADAGCASITTGWLSRVTGFTVVDEQEETLERIQDRENVVGGNPEDTGGEEGETPSYTHHATQSHDDWDASYIGVYFCATFSTSHSLETKEPGHYDDEGSEGEEEDQRIVTYVDNVVHVIVRYPAYGHIVFSVTRGNHLFAIFSWGEQDHPNDTR